MEGERGRMFRSLLLPFQSASPWYVGSDGVGGGRFVLSGICKEFRWKDLNNILGLDRSWRRYAD